MVRGASLGELEQLVMITVLRLDDDAYGMEIRREIADRTGRDVAIGAVYSALDRLERKGLLSSWLGEPEPAPGGRSRRLYRATEPGREALARSLGQIRSLLDGLDLGSGLT